MKNWLLLLFVGLFISCKNGPDTNKQSKQPSKLKDSIIYYKPNYANDIDTILSSGEIGKNPEVVWGVSTQEIKNLPKIDIKDFDYNKVILNTEKYLKHLYNPIELEFKSIELQIVNKGSSNQFNYLEVTFSYDEKEYVQKVPVLLDGRIILSNKE